MLQNHQNNERNIKLFYGGFAANLIFYFMIGLLNDILGIGADFFLIFSGQILYINGFSVF